jgi:hypothetical protein
MWGRIAGVLINLGEEKPCYCNYFTKITFLKSVSFLINKFFLINS